MNQNIICCADCGNDGGVSLKACKSCMQVKYCNAECQKNHWPKHKKECKQRAAELRDEALFKDPPAKEDCPICFLPMPKSIISCISLPPATIMSVPIYDFAEANEELARVGTEIYSTCCGKSICGGCIHSFRASGNNEKCAFCKADRMSRTDEEMVEEIKKRMEENDAASIFLLANCYYNGRVGLQQDQTKALELYIRAAKLGYNEAHFHLGNTYEEEGDSKKAKFYFEAAAIAGHEGARNMLGFMDLKSRNMKQAVKHWIIAALSGDCHAMDNLLLAFRKGYASKDEIDSTLEAYNNTCAEMQSEARDAYIRSFINRIGEDLRIGEAILMGRP
jgi:tetratricopeptide (TPR) repeat protein